MLEVSCQALATPECEWEQGTRPLLKLVLQLWMFGHFGPFRTSGGNPRGSVCLARPITITDAIAIATAIVVATNHHCRFLLRPHFQSHSPDT
eukprot:13970139-Alexandrium_andersonii.AAC.1